MTAKPITSHILCVLFFAAAMACAQLPASGAERIEAAGSVPYDFSSNEISELSGISYLDEDRFAVVSDKGGELALVTIRIDRQTGEILQAGIDQVTKLEGGKDLEDLALAPRNGLAIVVDEADHSVAFFHVSIGKRIQSAIVPDVFKRARPNLGFESVAVSADGRHFWVANEEPLTSDGPRATVENGALIRLQQFNFLPEPVSQFAYRVDPHRGDGNVIRRAQSGVVGLVALPNGGLIVMERELGGEVLPTFRTRLYLIDTEEATDTSAIDALSEDIATPVRKQFLFESNTGLANFEGITLGPRLNNGDYALILVSDDGGGKRNPQQLLSLRIPGAMVEPASEQPSAISAE